MCEDVADGVISRQWLVGPFVSVGGFDWWQVDFSTVMDDAGWTLPDAVDVGGYSITVHGGTPTAPGAVLGYPPIHDHHATINGGGLGGDTALAYFDQTEDGQCPGEVDGFRCLTHEHDFLEKGFAQTGIQGLRATPLRMFSIFNDARPDESPPLTWVRGRLATHL
jgi:hypothetical protein